jgi:hypothetical protein
MTRSGTSPKRRSRKSARKLDVGVIFSQNMAALPEREQDSTGKEPFAPGQKDRGLAPVGDPFHTRHTRAVGAAVEVAICLDAVSYHLDAAVLAGRRESVVAHSKLSKVRVPSPGMFI